MRVCHIVKTTSLSSDGRLQKWVKSLAEQGMDSEVLALQDDNNKYYEQGYCGSAVHTISLHSRKLFTQRKGYFFKVPEYAFKTFSFLRKQKETKTLVFHDVQQYLNLFIAINLIRNKQLIWDLHELPHNVMFKYSPLRSFLRYLLKKVDIVVYTNKERRDFIMERLNVQERSYTILNNFPDLNYIKSERRSLPTELKRLRPGVPYVIWLGAATIGRNFTTFLKAYETMLSGRFNLVILGRIDPEYRSTLNKYIEINYCYNAFIPQQRMIDFIDHAHFSVVFYDSRSPNNLLCEPNRLYQLITRHIPCIVGNNPTMGDVIKSTGGAVVLSDDGREVLHLKQGIDNLLTDFDEYKRQLESNSIIEQLNWDDQFINHVAPLLLLSIRNSIN